MYVFEFSGWGNICNVPQPAVVIIGLIALVNEERVAVTRCGMGSVGLGHVQGPM